MKESTERRINMFEVYVLVPVRKSVLGMFVGLLSLVLGVFSFVLSCISRLFTIPMLVFGGIGYYMTFCSGKEYEYAYFDGDIRIAKVMNKSRRKQLEEYSMGDVLCVAPAGDRSVLRYEGDSMVKVKNYTSKDKSKPYYEMVVAKEGATTLVKFEPDEKFLDAMMVKYAQKVVKG